MLGLGDFTDHTDYIMVTTFIFNTVYGYNVGVCTWTINHKLQVYFCFFWQNQKDKKKQICHLQLIVL